MAVLVVGLKYTMRRADCVAERPWSPKSDWMLARRLDRRSCDVRCGGLGREKTRYAGGGGGGPDEDEDEDEVGKGGVDVGVG